MPSDPLTRKRPPSRHLLFVAFAVLFSACTHVISEPSRMAATPALSFAQVAQNPDLYRGARLIVGGVIVVTRNLPDGTEIEVVQKELDSSGYPRNEDYSAGRFIFRQPSYLESEIFAKGRKVTGLGRIAGARVEKVGEADYRFPVLEIEELHLWERETQAMPYPYGWWGYPYYSPFYRPWWGYPYW